LGFSKEAAYKKIEVVPCVVSLLARLRFPFSY
jgi:hypothetical protein